MVDEHGRRVFVNADPPVPPGSRARTSTASARRNSFWVHRGKEYVLVSKDELERMARDAAERHKLDPVLVRAVIEAESNWIPSAVSFKGAQGLMQLVRGTAERLGVDDMFDPEKNLEAGVKHLRTLLERYNGDLDKALAAYNAGAGAVDRAGGVPNYPETRTYVQKITDAYFRPGSGRAASAWNRTRPIYRMVDERGRLVFTNE